VSSDLSHISIPSEFSLEETGRIVEDLGRHAVGVPADVTEPSACQTLVDTAVRELGNIDILVKNAGVDGRCRRCGRPPSSSRRC
jgi:NAD(P)-dependent dehydrogenase (short-subunit alcohol dehydrogenase family)